MSPARLVTATSGQVRALSITTASLTAWSSMHVERGGAGLIEERDEVVGDDRVVLVETGRRRGRSTSSLASRSGDVVVVAARTRSSISRVRSRGTGWLPRRTRRARLATDCSVLEHQERVMATSASCGGGFGRPPTPAAVARYACSLWKQNSLRSTPGGAVGCRSPAVRWAAVVGGAVVAGGSVVGGAVVGGGFGGGGHGGARSLCDRVAGIALGVGRSRRGRGATVVVAASPRRSCCTPLPAWSPATVAARAQPRERRDRPMDPP